ncbi:unnamed protein product [Paramecium octaurelia]|uniref:Uncharacterized protein n=1 Tax=Paramecium octaurelia TaxID=43137 RepID=A0A8S1VYF8_PAROT|nr:unnamed protein product [Paramecium octaurelia]
MMNYLYLDASKYQKSPFHLQSKLIKFLYKAKQSIICQNQSQVKIKKISNASFEQITGLLYSNVELLDQSLSKECLDLLDKLLQQKNRISKKEMFYIVFHSFLEALYYTVI